MTVIGDTLRRERLRRNLELDEISRELKISAKFLEAIEDEQFDKLPRGVFAKSFVRQYARLLGLDEDELAEGVQRAVDPPSGGAPAGGVLFAEHAPISKPSEIRVPPMEVWENVSDSRSSRSSSLPALALVVVAMLACSGLYAWWQRSRRATPVHEDVAAQTAPIERPSVPAAAPPESAKTVDPNVGVRPTPPGSPVTAAPLEKQTAPSAATAPTATPVVSPPPNPNAPVRVAVTADELVWVLARSDGKFAFSGTLEANETRTFDANGTLLLRLGNAGGVNIKLNGQPVGSVGPKGQVRTVQFTSGGFQIVAPPKPVLPLDDLL
jgi:cytoskeleton protein RodZ